MSDSMITKTALISGFNGDDIEAYLVEPTEAASPRGGVVVIHHLPGYDRSTKEIARRIAELGYDVVMPNLYWRQAPGAAPDDAAATARAQGGIPDEQLIGDVGGAAAYLRGLSTSTGKVGTIGFCSGGRQSVVAGCSLDIDAIVDCYGGALMYGAPASSGLSMPGIASLLPELSGPLLGLFGRDDSFPGPDEVADFDKTLTDLGKVHDFHSYEGAGHAFFAVDRPSYRVEAANDGWEQIASFYAANLV